jgi:hypothetical protein
VRFCNVLQLRLLWLRSGDYCLLQVPTNISGELRTSKECRINNGIPV